MTWKFEWITNWETISSEAFQQKWLNWYNQAENSHIFFHPALGMAWNETYRPIRNIEPLFCMATEGGTTIFFPLIIWKRNWKNAFQLLIVPLGHSDFDYHDPLVNGQKTVFLDGFYDDLLIEIKKNKSFDKFEINGIRSNIGNQGWKSESEYYFVSRSKSKSLPH